MTMVKLGKSEESTPVEFINKRRAALERYIVDMITDTCNIVNNYFISLNIVLSNSDGEIESISMVSTCKNKLTQAVVKNFPHQFFFCMRFINKINLP